MKIYTKTGDMGTTGLYSGPRVAKDHPRIEAYGTVDELNAALGMARAAGQVAEIEAVLARVQHELFAVGAELATREPVKHGTHWIGASQISALERAIDDHEERLKPLEQFILPAGDAATVALHVARAICRRAERRVIALDRLPGEGVSHGLIVYLNRLGDLLFVFSRVATAAAGNEDELWNRPAG